MIQPRPTARVSNPPSPSNWRPGPSASSPLKRRRPSFTEARISPIHIRDITRLDDAALAQCIQTEQIDVLIDLSGHTAGSRLSVFAHRPAPVQLSWLGYFATTGLTTLDAVLLDPWHAPEGTEAQFVEPILRLPAGRWCYQPVPWAPKELSPPPAERNGWITFGSFNNTAKLNDGVYDLWARILAVVPDSRLILKWRTFNDAALRQRVTQAFVARGIAAERIELRGPQLSCRPAERIRGAGYRARSLPLHRRPDQLRSAVDGRAGDHLAASACGQSPDPRGSAPDRPARALGQRRR
ncbi:O-linked N-acetylglucosamine transferase family protein [Thiorhodovibrio frisius]|uniref:O-linked N-acetylglucosamine transferase family protein n=1 Tax=Thiorhodovibrio frisius TaxID=631362 RepID=UPI0028BE1E45|nr:hypothetical protein [Thiorhodovibrio frisius]